MSSSHGLVATLPFRGASGSVAAAGPQVVTCENGRRTRLFTSYAKESQLEASASLEIAKHTLLSCGLILAIGTLTALAAQKIRIPDVAVFLVAGMLIGPAALGLIDIKADSALNQIILLFGASYILFDGGASLRFNVLKQVWITIVVIATVGVLITAVITGLAAYVVLGIPLIVALLLGATLASTDPATLVPIFRQVHIRDRVAQTVMSESAFNDAMGAILTFGVLAVAMGTGEFSLTSSLFDLVKQSLIGIAAGAVFGYLAALLIAHERWAFLAEYAPVVTLVAVIGAYFAADGMQASGFMAVFVFGIVLGNKETFGFEMEAGEAQKLDEYVLTTAFIMRLFIFILLGAQVDFALMRQYWLGGVIVVAVSDAGRAPRDGFPVCGARSARTVEFWRDAVHVLDPRNRRHSGRTRRPAARHESAGRTDDRFRHLHRHPDDDPDPGADHEMAGAQARAAGGTRKALTFGNRVAAMIPICKVYRLQLENAHEIAKPSQSKRRV